MWDTVPPNMGTAKLRWFQNAELLSPAETYEA